jgi:hypothetical protein
LRTGPELIQGIVFSFGSRENVNNHISIVYQHPAALVHTLHVARAYIFFIQFYFNITGDSFYLPLAVAATNYKIIGYNGNFADVQQYNIFRFFIVRYFYNGTCQVNRFDKKYSFETKLFALGRARQHLACSPVATCAKRLARGATGIGSRGCRVFRLAFSLIIEIIPGATGDT